MKRLTILFFLLAFVTYGQKPCYKYGVVKPIDSSVVIKMTISKQAKNKTEQKQLTKEQTEMFINKWNNAKGQSFCQFDVLYVINVELKDGSKRFFRINGADVKDGEADMCYDIQDSNFIKNLWSKTK